MCFIKLCVYVIFNIKTIGNECKVMFRYGNVGGRRWKVSTLKLKCRGYTAATLSLNGFLPLIAPPDLGLNTNSSTTNIQLWAIILDQSGGVIERRKTRVKHSLKRQDLAGKLFKSQINTSSGLSRLSTIVARIIPLQTSHKYEMRKKKMSWPVQVTTSRFRNLEREFFCCVIANTCIIFNPLLTDIFFTLELFSVSNAHTSTNTSPTKKLNPISLRTLQDLPNDTLFLKIRWEMTTLCMFN